MKNSIQLPTYFGRIIITCAAFAAASIVTTAQVAPAASVTSKNDENTGVTEELPVFTVVSTGGKGYVSRSAVGLKANEVLMKNPQSVSLITSDFIEDLGQNDTARTLQYAGVHTAFGQESLSVRGTRIGNALLDEMPDNASPTDNVNIDSIVIVRGPAATLYRGASLGGLVLKNSKWPLPKPLNTITLLADQHGMFRTELDSTGPLGRGGDAKFGYRLTGVIQEGENYFRNWSDRRKSVHPSFEVAYKNTLIRVGLDYQLVSAYPSPNNILKPDGSLYTGGGRKESYFPSSGNMNDALRRALRLIVVHKFSENWTLKLAAEPSKFTLWGPVEFVSAVSWPAQTISFQSRLNYLLAIRRDVQFDMNGRYTIGRFPMQTTFGAIYNETEASKTFIAHPTFGTVTVPINNPQMHLIRAPVASEYTVSDNLRSLQLSYNANGFVQQTVDLIPDRLLLVGGVTYQKLKTNNTTNLATKPPAVTTEGAKNLHRYGIVFNITKEVMVYANESTTFTPSSPFNIDINGNVLPGPAGKGQEAGFKTSLLNGRFSSTFSYFKIVLSNQSFFAGILPSGVNYFVPIGTTTQKGFDFDIAASPLPNLEFVAAYYHGTVLDQAGVIVPNSYTSHTSFVGRYKFQDGAVKGLTLGAGYTRVGGRNIGRGNYNTGTTPLPATLNLKTGNLLGLFASFRMNSRWLARLNVDNVLDETYAASGQLATSVVPSTPRTVSGSMTFEF